MLVINRYFPRSKTKTIYGGESIFFFFFSAVQTSIDRQIGNTPSFFLFFFLTIIVADMIL